MQIDLLARKTVEIERIVYINRPLHLAFYPTVSFGMLSKGQEQDRP